MDILKYVFGIDPVREDREFLHRQRAALQKPAGTHRSPTKNQVSPEPTHSTIKRSITRKY